MRLANNDKQRRHRLATSKAMVARAIIRACPACQRKNALKLIRQPFGPNIYVCRWCPHEHAAGGHG